MRIEIISPIKPVLGMNLPICNAKRQSDKGRGLEKTGMAAKLH